MTSMHKSILKAPLQLLAISLLAFAGRAATAQDLPASVPLLSGGIGFLHHTDAGATSLQPAVSPLAAIPLGSRFLIESRAFISDNFQRKNGTSGPYQSNTFAGLTYLQLDTFVAPKLTLTAGYYLTPFGTYNERLTPIWISNFQDGPLILPIGAQTGSSLGAMVRGAAYSTPKIQLNYVAYFSANSSVTQFNAPRSTGGQFSMYLPEKRLEIGTSYTRVLQGQQSNPFGFHVWWQPYRVPLEIRSEYAHGPNSQGYWVEAAYRLSQWTGPSSALGRLAPIFRMQQTFRESPGQDSLPAANTQRADFGLDYHLPHEVRINTSYSRQFSSTGNQNIWETALIYRFLFPAWKGGSK
jgi:hypothetical protein